jgi:hypothetical protein
VLYLCTIGFGGVGRVRSLPGLRRLGMAEPARCRRGWHGACVLTGQIDRILTITDAVVLADTLVVGGFRALRWELIPDNPNLAEQKRRTPSWKDDHP